MKKEVMFCDICGEQTNSNFDGRIVDTPIHLINNSYQKVYVELRMQGPYHVCDKCEEKIMECAFKEMEAKGWLKCLQKLKNQKQ